MIHVEKIKQGIMLGKCHMGCSVIHEVQMHKERAVCGERKNPGSGKAKGYGLSKRLLGMPKFLDLRTSYFSSAQTCLECSGVTGNLAQNYMEFLFICSS